MTRSVFTEQYEFVRHFLIKARKDAGLSQRKLSAMLDMSPSFVGKYEQGERRLDIVETLYLCKILNKDPVKLVDSINRISLVASNKIIGRK